LAILQRPYAGQVKNLTPPAAGCGGWFLAVGGVICCGRWAAGLAGCGVGRCWRWAAGCCEVWQGVQAVQLVGCGVIGAALAVPVLPGAGGWRNIRVPRPALPGYFPAFPRGGRRQHPARAGLLIRQAGQAGRWAKEKGQGRRRGVRCCSGLWSALAAMVPAGCVPVPVVGLICWRCRWAWSALAPFPLSAFQRHGWRWRCSIRVNFAVCRRGQILHLTGLRGRCRALT
jgi:hypothetical protein